MAGSRRAGPQWIPRPLHASRRCRRPATTVGTSPTPWSLIWRSSTKSLVSHSIGHEVLDAAWDTRARPRGDVHVSPWLNATVQPTHRWRGLSILSYWSPPVLHRGTVSD